MLIGVFIFLVAGYRYADSHMKMLAAKTVKTINRIGLAVGMAGGILWYLFQTWIYMPVTVLGVIIYFLFYSYDSMEQGGG